MKKHTEQLALIHEAYNNLPDMQDGFRDVTELLLDMNEKSERRHRKPTPGGYPGISITLAAKYFVIKHLVEGWEEPDRYKIDDITNVRTEVLYAQVYAKIFYGLLRDWVKKYSESISKLNYSELVKG